MIDKEFVLVSQGIEIYRTKSQEKAIGMVKEYNDEYFDYKQKCYDNYERPADNYVDLEIEYSNEKEKDKEIERLNKDLDTSIKICNNRQKEIVKLNNIINKLEKDLEQKWLKLKDAYDFEVYSMAKEDKVILDKLKELKGSDE